MPLSLKVEFRSIPRAAQGAHAAAAALVSNAALISAGTKIIVTFLKAEAPRRTGAGANSIQAKGNQIYAFTYMVWQAEGTKPHLIRPKKAKMLRFTGKSGGLVFTKLVHHPGTKPNDYRERAIAKAKPALQVLMLENGRRLVKMIQKGA